MGGLIMNFYAYLQHCMNLILYLKNFVHLKKLQSCSSHWVTRGLRSFSLCIYLRYLITSLSLSPRKFHLNCPPILSHNISRVADTGLHPSILMFCITLEFSLVLRPPKSSLILIWTRNISHGVMLSKKKNSGKRMEFHVESLTKNHVSERK